MPLIGEGTNYCTDQDGIQFTGKPLPGWMTFQPWWLDAIDGLIEQHMGAGYKAATKTVLRIGSDTQLIRLASRANSVSLITEDDRGMDPTEWRLDPGGRLITRKQMAVNNLLYTWPLPRPVWMKMSEYFVTYTEPDLSQLPPLWRLCAAHCAGEVIMFIIKYKDNGIALTSSEQESAGKAAVSGSTTFPPSLLEEMNRIIKATLKKVAI